MHISKAWCHECREATREERTAHNFSKLWVGEHTHGALRTMKHFGFRWACWRISIDTAFERWRQEGQVVWASLSYKSAQRHPERTEILSQEKEWSEEQEC